MVTKLISIILIGISATAHAHCPSHFKPENICFMLDQNIIYIYDRKGEHNGPYQDLKESTILSIKAEGKQLKFSHLARGLYKIDSIKQITNLELEIQNSKKTFIQKIKN